MQSSRPLLPLVLVVLIALTGLSCGPPKVNRRVSASYKDGDISSIYLKVHMKDGNLYVLSNWRLDSNVVKGDGVLLNQNRDTVERKTFTIATEGVALYETNTLGLSSAYAGLTFVSVLNLITIAYCISNPKACFGSCPTFYINDGKHDALVAEGFSSSIAPSLEESDIDALYKVHPTGRTLTMKMKNEALETHVVKSVDIVAVPHTEGARVFKTESGEYFESDHQLEPIQCYGNEGSIEYQIRSLDGIERHSLTDPNDLAKKETIDITFSPDRSGDYGLVLASRQAFVSTYLFYQGLSYMGRHAGDYFAELERGTALKKQVEDFEHVLGGIEVWVETSRDTWEKKGEVCEMGPIATDVHLVRLQGVGIPRHVRLRLSKGSWRLDWIALAHLTKQCEPRTLPQLSREHTAEQLLLTLDSHTTQPNGALITFPGDEYTYTYELPQSPETFEYFVESRGYYIEWMREDWLKDENVAKAAMMLMDPEYAAKNEAKNFKNIEAEMETSFWKSKIRRAVQ